MLAFPQAGRFFKVRLQFAVGQRVLVVKGLPKNGQAITLVRSMATAVVVGQIMCMPHQVNGQGGDQDCCGIIRLILQLEEAATGCSKKARLLLYCGPMTWQRNLDWLRHDAAMSNPSKINEDEGDWSLWVRLLSETILLVGKKSSLEYVAFHIARVEASLAAVSSFLWLSEDAGS